MSNYPPGVSGNEPQITGEWPCFDCGAILPEEKDCPKCGGRGVDGGPDEFGNHDPCDTCEASGKVPLDENDETCPGGCRVEEHDHREER